MDNLTKELFANHATRKGYSIISIEEMIQEINRAIAENRYSEVYNKYLKHLID